MISNSRAQNGENHFQWMETILLMTKEIEKAKAKKRIMKSLPCLVWQRNCQNNRKAQRAKVMAIYRSQIINIRPHDRRTTSKTAARNCANKKVRDRPVETDGINCVRKEIGNKKNKTNTTMIIFNIQRKRQ